MKKQLKPFIFTALTCTFLLGAGISIEAASKVSINDTNFAPAVKEYAENADSNKDGYLSKKEASKITKVRFFSQYNIDSFKGIEYFANIKNFYYRADYATEDYDDVNIYETSTAPEINLSGFKKLTQVTINSRNPYLKTVNLQDCTNLKNVTIEGRREDCIDTLNLKGCTNLRSLTLNWTNVNKLNLSGLKKLKEVTVTDDRESLQPLNLKNCSSLETVSVSGDRLSKLKGAKKLKDLVVNSDSLKSLDLSTNSQLKSLDSNCENIISLDLRKNKNIQKIECINNHKLTELKVKGCKKLKNIRCDNTALSKLNVKTNTNLQRLICRGTDISKLNLKNNKKLNFLWCTNTNIDTLDLSKTKIRKPSALKCDPDVTVTYATK